MALDSSSLESKLTEIFETACNDQDDNGQINGKSCSDYMAEECAKAFKDYIKGAQVSSTSEVGSGATGTYAGSTASGTVEFSSALDSGLKTIFNAPGDTFSTTLSTLFVTDLAIMGSIKTSGGGNYTTPSTPPAQVPATSSGQGNLVCVPTVMSGLIDSAIASMDALASTEGASSNDFNSLLSSGIASGLDAMIKAATKVVNLTLTPTGTGSAAGVVIS